jgi:hypothetical protein
MELPLRLIAAEAEISLALIEIKAQGISLG